MRARNLKVVVAFTALAVVAAGIYGWVRASSSVAAGVERRALWDGRASVRFRALTSPEMVPAAKADFMAPTDYVLGITVAGQSRAYPSAYIGFHHIVNDKVFTPSHEARWIGVTYCDMCGTGILFDLMLDGKPRDLEFYGLYNGTIALCDRETQSVFLPNTGKFVTGPLLGKELKMGSLLDTTWAEWKRLHPATLVMAPDEMDRQYYAESGRHVRAMDAFPMEFFAPTVTRKDNRLSPFARILGVSVPAAGAGRKAVVLHRAYTILSLEASGGALQDSLGGEPVCILFDPKSVSAVAISPTLAGVQHRLEARKSPDGGARFYDRETGTRWSIEGRGEDGPLKGKELPRLEAYLGEWYAWSAYFPDTSIYGRSDAPQPAAPRF
jgi:hypothetical protein